MMRPIFADAALSPGEMARPLDRAFRRRNPSELDLVTERTEIEPEFTEEVSYSVLRAFFSDRSGNH